MDLMEESLKDVKKEIEEAYKDASWIKFEEVKKEIGQIVAGEIKSGIFIDFEKMKVKNKIFGSELA